LEVNGEEEEFTGWGGWRLMKKKKSSGVGVTPIHILVHQLPHALVLHEIVQLRVHLG